MILKLVYGRGTKEEVNFFMKFRHFFSKKRKSIEMQKILTREETHTNFKNLHKTIILNIKKII